MQFITQSFIYLLACLFLLSFSSGLQAKEGDELIGTEPPEWRIEEWLNSEPLKLADLKGKVVLVRWFTGAHCPYCRASAPALNKFYADYKDQDFTVIGIYHHKSPEPLTYKGVKNLIEEKEFRFPVGIDFESYDLKKWWLHQPGRKWTSVSFLLDKEGKICFIHPGGQYRIGDKDYKDLKSAIENEIQK